MMSDEKQMRAGSPRSDDRQAGSPLSDEPRGWYSRGYLSHFDGGEITQFITFRLADSLPTSVIAQYKTQLEQQQITEIEFHKKIDRYLDSGNGTLHLKNTGVAEIVEENLMRFDGERYKLLHWVIMANHVHVMLTPISGVLLASIMHSLKSFTANRANKLLSKTGSFWSSEYFDRYIRDEKHFQNSLLRIFIVIP